MKNYHVMVIMTLVLSMLASQAFSQIQVDIDNTIPAGYVSIEHVFEHLDLSQVPTGLLEDYSMRLIPFPYV